MNASLLIVDDEPINLEIIAEYLDGEPFELTLANNGEEAWELLQRSSLHFHAVVLDRMMPGMSGIDLLKKLKADTRLASIPVIMQTAAAAPEQVAEGLQAGAYYYLTKPYERSSLLTIIRAALEHTRREDIGSHGAEDILAISLLNEAQFAFQTLEDAEALARLLAQLGSDAGSAAMGLTELLVNGVEHGNLGIDFATKSQLKQDDGWEAEVARRMSLPEYRDKRVHVSIKKETGSWRITITDEGAGFDWHDFLDFSPERAFAPNGRGIAMAKRLAFTSMEYLGSGNTVELVMPAPAAN